MTLWKIRSRAGGRVAPIEMPLFGPELQPQGQRVMDIPGGVREMKGSGASADCEGSGTDCCSAFDGNRHQVGWAAAARGSSNTND